jgi:hypothetical protein
MGDSEEGMRAAAYAMAAAATQMHNAAGGIIHGADTFRNAASELGSVLDLDRQQREQQLIRLEQAAELQALTGLVDYFTATGAMDAAAAAAERLDALLRARGVL